MERGAPPSIFVNDGSFMERFKQLQQEKVKENDKAATADNSKPVKIISVTSNIKSAVNKNHVGFKFNDTRKSIQLGSGGKLAFSLKQKSKLVAAHVKLDTEEDEDRVDAIDDRGFASAKRPKLDQRDTPEKSSKQSDVAPPSPKDPTVKKVADKLASFVAKHGRPFEHITRQKNPGDTPFKFLFDESCVEYKYYEYRLAEEEKALLQKNESQTSLGGGIGPPTFKTLSASQGGQQGLGFQIPASALYYEAPEDARVSSGSVQASCSRTSSNESSAPMGADPISMMEFYMKKAAEEEKMRQPKQSKGEMPPPASLQGSSGHHMGDFIPHEELEKFLAKCNDAAAQKAAKEAAEKAKIQADNVGHKLLSKMGWKEGEGIGGSRKGMADPIMAGDVKTNNLGVGASAPGEVMPDDDIYEQYKKRMMLGYKYRPNPLGNPRKAYY